MEKQELIKNFLKILIGSIKIQNQVGDRFFYRKLSEQLNGFAENFINLLSSNEHTQQYYVTNERIFSDIRALLDIYNEIEYLDLVKEAAVLLKIRRDALALKLQILRIRGLKSENIKSINPEQKTLTAKPLVSLKKESKSSDKINQNQQKILNFIKSYPEIRTKDIIHEFSAISDRTVKRNLTELLKFGVIKKRIDNKAVHYSVIDS